MIIPIITMPIIIMIMFIIITSKASFQRGLKNLKSEYNNGINEIGEYLADDIEYIAEEYKKG